MEQGELREPGRAGRKKRKVEEAAAATAESGPITTLEDLPQAADEADVASLLKLLDEKCDDEEVCASHALEKINTAANSTEAVGLRVGELACRFYTGPHLPLSAFLPMLSWMDQQHPGCVGEINHREHFVLQFGRVMTARLNLCSALEHWQCVPALRLPSDFARAVDGLTCMGEPLLIIVHCLTDITGDMVWQLVAASPNSSNALRAGRQASTNEPIHQWKSGPSVAEHVFACETGLSISGLDAIARHATTTGDGGYVGAYSCQLVHCWAGHVRQTALFPPHWRLRL